MVKDTVRSTALDAMEVALGGRAISPGRRRAIAALFDLDATLGRVLRTTREPLIGQMRFTWWHEALVRLDRDAPPAEPVLMALAADLLPVGVAGAALAEMIDGWEALLEPVLDRDALDRHARDRGAGLFEIAARVLGPSEPDGAVAAAGEAWALADLATNVREPMVAAAARELVQARLAVVAAGRWPEPVRPLGALALLSTLELVDAGNALSRWMTLLRFRLTGRWRLPGSSAALRSSDASR